MPRAELPAVPSILCLDAPKSTTTISCSSRPRIFVPLQFTGCYEGDGVTIVIRPNEPQDTVNLAARNAAVVASSTSKHATRGFGSTTGSDSLPLITTIPA